MVENKKRGGKVDWKAVCREIDQRIREDELLEPEDRMSDEEYLDSLNYEFDIITDEDGTKRFGWVRKK